MLKIPPCCRGLTQMGGWHGQLRLWLRLVVNSSPLAGGWGGHKDDTEDLLEVLPEPLVFEELYGTETHHQR